MICALPFSTPGILSAHPFLDPIIFRGLKSLTLDDPQQRCLLLLAQERISVYSPHTAVDAVPGGMADWLCDIVVNNSASRSTKPGSRKPLSPDSSPPHYSTLEYPQVQELSDRTISVVDHSRRTIHPCPSPVPEGFESAGMGRVVTFSSPETLGSLINRIGNGIGSPSGIAVAVPQSRSVEHMKIHTVGVCPGSGAGVLMKGTQELPDLLLTGELSHHDALSAIERGSAVITLFHSNTERGYLRECMQDKLRHALRKELELADHEELNSIVDAFFVEVSKADRDPYGISIRMD
jgi:putative NIF3 family GTP cyclohydrolase 1 type 2